MNCFYKISSCCNSNDNENLVSYNTENQVWQEDTIMAFDKLCWTMLHIRLRATLLQLCAISNNLLLILSQVIVITHDRSSYFQAAPNPFSLIFSGVISLNPILFSQFLLLNFTSSWKLSIFHSYPIQSISLLVGPLKTLIRLTHVIHYSFSILHLRLIHLLNTISFDVFQSVSK